MSTQAIYHRFEDLVANRPREPAVPDLALGPRAAAAAPATLGIATVPGATAVKAEPPSPRTPSPLPGAAFLPDEDKVAVVETKTGPHRNTHDFSKK